MHTITDVFVRNVKPTDKQVYYWDSNLRGFGLRVNPKGAKAFIVLIGSGNRKTLGRYPHLSLADARSEAKRLLAEKTLGKLNRVRVPFKTAKKLFIEHAQQTTKEKTAYEYERILDAHYDFKGSVGDITAHDVVSNLNKLNSTPSEKHHAFAVGRIFFNWCRGQRYIDRSPIENILVPGRPEPRERVLSDLEFIKILNTATGTSKAYHRIVMLLILTAQRRAQIANLQWDWVKEDRFNFPASIMKGGKEHHLPLQEATKLILDRCPHFNDSPYIFPSMRDKGTVFNGWSKCKKQFDTDCGVSDWTLHDLRRTFATKAPTLGISQVVTEHILNHISGGAQSQIARVYNRYDYFDEMSDALLDWQTYVCEQIDVTDKLTEPGP